MTDITQLHRELVTRVLDSDGTVPPELRRAAFDNAGLDAGLDEPMHTLIDKVAHHADRGAASGDASHARQAHP